MKLKAVASRIRRDIRHFGVVRTAYEVFMTGIQLCVDFRIMRVTKKEVITPEFLEGGEALQWQFFDERQLFELARNPENKLAESFLQSALGKGDICWGGLDGEVIAYRCWYANTPTDDKGLTFHFRPDYAYAYNAVTHPKYRGQRLYTISGNLCLRELLGRGFKGMVFYTDSHNFQALRAAFRFGVEDVGYIVALRIGSHAWIHASRGCREQGIFLAKPAVATKPVPTA